MAGEILYISLNNIPCVDPRIAYQTRPPTFEPLHFWHKANSVVLRRGRRPSECRLFILKSTKEAINFATAQTVRIHHSGGTVVMPYWYAAECEAATEESDDNQIFYLKLEDPRHVGLMKTIGVTPSAIQNTHRNKEAPQPATVTWQSVLNSLWSELPILARAASASAPTLAVTPSSKAENLVFDGVSAWDAICKTLEACGHVPVFNPVSGAYSFLAYNGTQSGLSAAITAVEANKIWDGNIPACTSTCPEKVGVVFLNEITDDNRITGYKESHHEEVSTGIAGSVAGTRIDVVDTTFVEKTGATIDNQSQMDDRLVDLRRTIEGVSRAAASRNVKAYYGYESFLPGEELTAVTFKHGIDAPHRTIIEYNGPLEFNLPEPYRVGSGGTTVGGASIQYTIDSITTATSSSPYNGKVVATVTVEIAPCDRPELIGESVQVVDWAGCIFDATEADLVGVWGWASERVGESLETGVSPGTLTPCHWAADNRCC
jgi:hypothetical protein